MNESKFPLISVVVPVYKVEKYLERCLDSLAAQDYENFEVVCVDDGSPDSCGEILEKRKQADKRFRVLHQPNAGVSAARNAGVALCRGEYLSFVDPDDYVEPDFLSFLYRALTEEDADVASCGVVNELPSGRMAFDVRDGRLLMNAEEALERMCYNDAFYVTLWDKLYKKCLFDGILFPEGRLFEDTGATYRVIDRANKIVYDGKPKYHYITNAGSITTSVFNPAKLDYLDMAEEMAQFIETGYPRLSRACNRKRLHALFSTLMQLVNSGVRDRRIEREITGKIRKLRRGVFFDPRAPLRDKAAILALLPGFSLFSFLWNCYRKVKK